MVDENYLTELESRINSFITNAKIKYEDLKEQSTNIDSYYRFNQDIDELARLIEHILYYKKQLSRLLNAKDEPDYGYRPMTDEELSELRYKKLLEDKKIVIEQIKVVDEAITKLKQETLLHRLLNKFEIERFHLTGELGSLNSALRIYEGNPDLTDGEIDIYINGTDETVAFQGIIYLHGTGIEIGEISYRGPENNRWLGDIGYTINQKYQGHNYAYKALNLITPLIIKKGIDKALITTYTHNTASIKTIEKYGGVHKDTILQDVLVFECDLKKILENKQQQSIKM